MITALIASHILLSARDEEEGEVLAVKEYSKSSANYSLGIGRIGKSKPRLPLVEVLIYIARQARFIVPPQAVIQG